jgi:sarcosine oxidase subunit beta
VSAAYFLAKSGLSDVLLIAERPPLTLTSDRSTECYRNWWPDPAILALMNRSIELLEQLADDNHNSFHMNRRGYLYVIGSEARIPAMSRVAERISGMGGGPLRTHEHGAGRYVPHAVDGFHGQQDGADLFLGAPVIHAHFPYLTPGAVAALHVRKAGWLSAQQLGMHLLDQVRAMGGIVVNAQVAAVEVAADEVRGVRLSSGELLECEAFVDAADPYLKPIVALLGIDLPVQTGLHLRAALKDPLGVVPRKAPLLIWDEAQSLPWQDDERDLLIAEAETSWLTGPLPSGAHTRPEGPADSQSLLMLWDYRARSMVPEFPIPTDEQYPEIVLRGLATMLPGLRAYLGRTARPQIDGGYYAKTPENRLLACPLPVGGAYVLGAVSGYGIMAACGAGELLAAHIRGTPLPAYAEDFSLKRYDDPKYQKRLEEWGDSGQL